MKLNKFLNSSIPTSAHGTLITVALLIGIGAITLVSTLTSQPQTVSNQASTATTPGIGQYQLNKTADAYEREVRANKGTVNDRKEFQQWLDQNQRADGSFK